jgi:hypothetical protein
MKALVALFMLALAAPLTGCASIGTAYGVHCAADGCH